EDVRRKSSDGRHVLALTPGGDAGYLPSCPCTGCGTGSRARRPCSSCARCCLPGSRAAPTATPTPWRHAPARCAWWPTTCPRPPRAEGVPVEQLRRELEAMKGQLRQMQDQSRKQEELIEKLSAERAPAAAAPAAPAPAASPPRPWSPTQPIQLFSTGKSYLNL